MQLTIPTTTRKYFQLALELLRSIPPLNTLNSKELAVLAELLYWDYHYRALDKEIRWKMVFDYSTKLLIMDHAYVDEQSLNNYLTSLRKKDILFKKTIKTNFGLDPLNPILTINFKINE
jgi:hypothetical protein